MNAWRDGIWTTADGLALHYRDYPGDPTATPALCVPGLTRNVRDFARLAVPLAGGRRVIAIELRGRGESQWADDPMTYVPPVYARDIAGFAAALGLGPVAWIGTSLGGIVAMLTAAADRSLLAGVLLNDIGPVIDPVGLKRIAAYTGRGSVWPDWDTAAAAMAATHAVAYPDYGPAEWRDMAERLCRKTADGIVADYDPAIAAPFSAPPPDPLPDPAPDPWRLADAMTGLPVLLVRGEISDILAAETADEMGRRIPGLDLLTVPRTGHAPTLDEPGCDEAIGRWLERVDKARG